MSSLNVEAELDVRATNVVVTHDALSVDLEDGRTITVPLAWYPRLKHGTPKERNNFQIEPYCIHWEDLDEDISIRGLLLGRKSQENPRIIKWWLDQRAKGRKTTVEDYFREKKITRTTVAKRRKKAG